MKLKLGPDELSMALDWDAWNDALEIASKLSAKLQDFI
jgi:hypothetical protein